MKRFSSFIKEDEMQDYASDAHGDRMADAKTIYAVYTDLPNGRSKFQKDFPTRGEADAYVNQLKKTDDTAHVINLMFHEGLSEENLNQRLAKDYSSSGLKYVGPYENDRNSTNAATFKAIVREAFGVQDVICGHHIVYVKEDARSDGFTYQVVEEIPSADALIFDHDVARKIFGPGFKAQLMALAAEPIETRDDLLAKLYFERSSGGGSPGAK